MVKNTINIRLATVDDVEAIMTIHYDAVNNIASADYSKDIIAAWSRPLDVHTREQFQKDFDHKIILVAELDQDIIGFCSLIPDQNELCACYVASKVGRKGVGRALVKDMEKVARQRGLKYIQLNSSLTAEKFYLSCGYEIIEYGTHTLRGGMLMDCVEMRKDL